MGEADERIVREVSDVAPVIAVASSRRISVAVGTGIAWFSDGAWVGLLYHMMPISVCFFNLGSLIL